MDEGGQHRRVPFHRIREVWRDGERIWHRHAYAASARRGEGIGGNLLDHLLQTTVGRSLVGTWVAAEWAIRFYEKHGFRRVTPAEKDLLLQTYWAIPERQVETSVVLERCDRVQEG